MAGIIDMAGNRITGLGAATGATDAVSRGYGDARYLRLAGGTLTGNVTSQDVSGIAYKVQGTIASDPVEISLDTNSGNRRITYRDSGSIIGYIDVNATSNMVLNANGVIALHSAVSRVVVGPLATDDAINQLQVNGTVRVSGIIHGVATPVLGTDAANKAYVDSLATFPLQAPDSAATSPSYSFATNSAVGLSHIGTNTTLLGDVGFTNILGADSATVGGTLLIQAGAATASGTAGNTIIQSGQGQGTADSGNLLLVASNVTGTGNAGMIQLETGGTARFSILDTGEFLLNGLSGPGGYGLVSGGPGVAPSWQPTNQLTILNGIAYENLTQNEFVAVFSNAGVCTVRKAYAGATNQYAAVGWVLASALTGASVQVVMTESKMDVVTVLNPGDTYYLSNTVPGDITNIAPSGSGEMIQTLGVAEDLNTLIVTMSRDPITL